MIAKFVPSVPFVLASIGASMLGTDQASAQPLLGPLPFAQCVKNVFGASGIAARVKWYEPSQVEYIERDPRGDNANTPDIDESIGQLKTGFAKPVKEETILVAQQSCMAGIKGQTAPKIAIVSVVGGKFANQAVSIAANTLIAAGGALACPATAGAGCAATVAVLSGGAQGAVSLATLGIPDAKEVFYIGIPGTIELKGTAFNPQWVDKTLAVAPLAYRANIDFCHNTLKDTATANNISVDFMSGQSLIQRQTIRGNVSDCATLSKGYLEAAISTPKPVTSVRVSTDGGDAMFIDQLRVYREDKIMFWDGRDNGGGWCLSKDANDYQGGWESGTLACSDTYSFSSPAN